MNNNIKSIKPLVCTVVITAETEKAFLFKQVEKDKETGKYMGVRESWFPKSQVDFTTDCAVADDAEVFEVEIQRWIAEQKEFNKPAPTRTAQEQAYTPAKGPKPAKKASTLYNSYEEDDVPFYEPNE